MVTWIERRGARRFSWRGGDCVSFALGGVKAQTGVDLLADIPRWRSQRQAARVVDTVGGLAEALDLRMDRVPTALAKRGDVAGIPDATFGVRLMLVEGRTLVGPGDSGLVRLDRSAMTIAWDAASARRVAVSPAQLDRQP